MSIICTTYTPGGVVMGADSRVTVNMQLTNTQDPSQHMTHSFPVSDNANKVFLLNKVQVGISAVSVGIGDNVQGVEQFIRDFEKNTVRSSDGIDAVAEKLQGCISNGSTYHIAGYEGTEQFFYSVSRNECKRLNMKAGALQYGVTCSGEAMAFQKIMGTEPKAALNFKAFSVLDAADFTEFIIRTTIDLQKFEMKPKTCGGAIDLLILTPEGAFWKSHKIYDSSFIPMPSSQRTSWNVTDKNGNPIN